MSRAPAASSPHRLQGHIGARKNQACVLVIYSRFTAARHTAGVCPSPQWSEDQDRGVSHSLIAVVLLALAGFLIGGAFTTWRNNARFLAGILGVCAALSVVGAVLWWK